MRKIKNLNDKPFIRKKISTLYLNTDLKKQIHKDNKISVSNLVNRSMYLYINNPAFQKLINAVANDTVDNLDNRQ